MRTPQRSDMSTFGVRPSPRRHRLTADLTPISMEDLDATDELGTAHNPLNRDRRASSRAGPGSFFWNRDLLAVVTHSDQAKAAYLKPISSQRPPIAFDVEQAVVAVTDGRRK